MVCAPLDRPHTSADHGADLLTLAALLEPVLTMEHSPDILARQRAELDRQVRAIPASPEVRALLATVVFEMAQVVLSAEIASTCPGWPPYLRADLVAHLRDRAEFLSTPPDGL